MKPNVVILTCHDLGRFLGAYGREVETDRIDEFSEDGVIFDNNFATAPQCSPSRGSIMTGKYPHNHGLMGLAHEGYGWELNEGEKTLPQYLKEAGYETHLFGLQHESEDPYSLGYEYVHGPGVGERRVEPTTGEFLNFLDEREGHREDRPLFVSIGFFEPHRPYGLDDYDNEDSENVTPPPFLPDNEGVREDLSGLYGMIYQVDESTGRIIDGLKEHGIYENTLFVFTVDHGIAMPRAKGTCYDPGVGTALIMAGPGGLAVGRRLRELISNVDLAPTILDYVGLEVPDEMDGRSFLPLLRGEEYVERDHLFLEMTWHDKYAPVRAIRTEKYKYIANFTEKPQVYLPADIYYSPAGEEVREEYYGAERPAEELYDLTEDPLETDNLADRPAMGDIKLKLRRKLVNWMRRTDDPLLERDVPPTEEQKRTLEETDFEN